MVIECWNCGHKFDGGVSHDELGWYSHCKECDSSFDVDVSEERYRVLISGNGGGKYEEYRTYDDFNVMYDAT